VCVWRWGGKQEGGGVSPKEGDRGAWSLETSCCQLLHMMYERVHGCARLLQCSDAAMHTHTQLQPRCIACSPAVSMRRMCIGATPCTADQPMHVP
jgi:hypothetical protein